MKRFRTVFFILTSFLLLSGCSGALDNYRLQSDAEGIPSVPKVVLGKPYSTILFKAKIEVYDRYYSGLFFFKKTSTDTTRVVFLSEFGLNLLDLEYRSNVFQVRNVQEFLNEDRIIETLKRDLKVLLQELEPVSSPALWHHQETTGNAVEVQTSEADYIYFYDAEKRLVRVYEHRGVFSGLNLYIDGWQKKFPRSLIFSHDWIKLRIQLDQLKVESL